MARWPPSDWGKTSLEDLLSGVTADDVAWARDAARKSEEEVYPGLPFTENEYLWVLLYEHVQRGQIHPGRLRHMRTVDLEYIAGHPLPHPDLIPVHDGDTPEQTTARRGRAMKIVENVTRATRELERRANRAAYMWAAGVGAAIGGCVAAIGTTWLG